MCEFNQRMAMPPIRDCHSETPLRVNSIPASSGQWGDRAAELPSTEADIIAQAIEDGAKITSDVEIYRYIGTSIIGLAFVPSRTENVRVFEYPPRRR